MEIQRISQIIRMAKSNATRIPAPFGSLRAVLPDSRLDAALINQWRNANQHAFFTWGTFPLEQTCAWLSKDYAANDLDIIFIAETSNAIPFGQLALYNFDTADLSCEIGRIVRGVPDIAPGGMYFAMQTAIHWATEELAVRRIFLEVFENNARARRLYERCGFRITQRLALRKQSRQYTQWVKTTTEPADAFALRMEFLPA